MTITNGYTTLAIVRSVLGIPASGTSNDSLIEATVEAVSRLIDNKTGRRFYTVAETRYFSAVDYDTFFCDDVTSITSLKTDDDGDGTFETTWSSSDYVTFPMNSAVDVKPITWIEASPNGNYSFPVAKKGVQLVGPFGYCTIGSCPKPIAEAAKIQSMRLFKRKDAPFGMIGGGEMQQMTPIVKLDPDVEFLIAPYVRRV